MTEDYVFTIQPIRSANKVKKIKFNCHKRKLVEIWCHIKWIKAPLVNRVQITMNLVFSLNQWPLAIEPKRGSNEKYFFPKDVQ